jgi:uncharacterized protein YaaN involved in tellurite resistance
MKMIAAVWKKNQEAKDSWLFYFPENLESFTRKYDQIQEQLEVIAGLDDMLSGMSNDNDIIDRLYTNNLFTIVTSTINNLFYRNAE